jgi:hypothetical protein
MVFMNGYAVSFSWFAKSVDAAVSPWPRTPLTRGNQKPAPQLLFRRNQRQIQTNRNCYEPFNHFDDWDEKLREDLIHLEESPLL